MEEISELPTSYQIESIKENINNNRNEIQLEDLIAYYPNYDTPGIQTIISAKEEFKELESSPTELPPKRGSYYKHQLLIQRLMRALDKIMMIHDPGTGKTCSFIGSAEYYRSVADGLEGTRVSLANLGKPIKRTYVLVKNKTLLDEFYDQLVCKCTAGKYEAKGEGEDQTNSRDKIKEWYEVLTYSEFGNKIEKTRKVEGSAKRETITIMSNEEIKDVFSNCLFFIDEVHNLQTSVISSDDIKTTYEDLSSERRRDQEDDSPLKNYDRIWKILHIAKNIKVILASGTPMINLPSELAKPLNLLLPINRQLDKNLDFSTLTIQQFEPLVRGLISYVRTLDTGIDIINKGVEITGSIDLDGEQVDIKTLVEPTPMGPCQTRGYLMEKKKTERNVDDNIAISSKKGISFDEDFIEDVSSEEEDESIPSTKPTSKKKSYEEDESDSSDEESDSDEEESDSEEEESDSEEEESDSEEEESDSEDEKIQKPKVKIVLKEKKELRKEEKELSKDEILPRTIPKIKIFQKGNGYQNKQIGKGREERVGKGEKSARLWRGLRDASMFVFPETYNKCGDNPLIGSKGYKKYVLKGKDRGVYRLEPKFDERIGTIDDLSNYSGKFASVLETLEKVEGNTFVYTDDFVKIGANLLSIFVTKLLGYEQYYPTVSAFLNVKKTIKKTEKAATCTSSDSEDKLKLKSGFTKKNRFALITGETPRDVVRNILDLFNSEDNVNGEYIKCIIASKVAKEGLNLANVQNIFLVSPSWNASSMYQAMYRAIRATSHVNLLEQKKKGMSPEEKSKPVRVDINVFRFASVYEGPSEGYEDNIVNKFVLDEAKKQDIDLTGNLQTIEVQMYQMSEYKDRKIGKVMRMLKEVAVDCRILYGRNYRSTDSDYSTACNYLPCEYSCFDPQPDYTDYSTYDVYYVNDLVDVIVAKIRKMFLVNDSRSLDQIIGEIPEMPAKFIIEGLSQIIRKRITLYNKYGFPCLLSEDGDRYYLISELDFYGIGQQDLLISWYTQQLIGTSSNNLRITTDIIRKDNDSEAAAEILEQEGDIDEIIDSIKDKKLLITLLEGLIIKDNPTQREQEVLDKFKGFIFEIQEPTTLIQKEMQKGQVEKKGRGRPPKDGGVTKIKRLKRDEFTSLKELLGEDIKSPKVKLHTLNLLRAEDTAYKTNSVNLKLDTDVRIFKPLEGEWRSLTNVEKGPYNILLQHIIKDKLQQYIDNYDVFGTIITDGKFRIVDKSTEDKRAESNLHHEKTGTVCKFMTKIAIYRLLAKFGIKPDFSYYRSIPKEVDKKTVKDTRTDLLKGDDKDLTDEQIKTIYQWSLIKNTKDNLCDVLQDYFEQNDMLYRI